jgi:ubiquinone/menaquinone biosynthesis C-methylase UbiE
MKRFYARVLFPRLLDFLMDRPAFAERRRGLLADARGKTLELGAGTGLNFPHYPCHVEHVTAVDINDAMPRRATRRREEACVDIAHVTLDGARLPMPDGSFDTVVSAWTLCSVADVASALREVRRVLKPEGRFLFLEHGLSVDPAVRRWQRWLNRLNRIVGDGCTLDRDIPALIRESGLSIERLEVFALPSAPSLYATHYRGIAGRA